MTESPTVGALVAALPEKYQPIFGHPELSDGSSRSCEDRLTMISDCARRLQAALGRPLRVLDLGCAQGFFSLSLAAEGHRVHGVDYLDLNVHVCEALAAQNDSYHATFEHGTVEDVIERLDPGEFDLVLGLSVFHHLVHARGVVSVAELCRRLSEVVGAGIFELALREEPLYWAPSLPQDPAELLSGYAFTRLLSRQPTHLSAVSRPLIYASSRFWYAGDVVGEFTSWSGESHAHGRGTHQHSRRYYFGEQVFVKKMTLGVGGRAEINLQEYHNEVAFLRQPPASFPAPRLIVAMNDSSDLYVARGMVRGSLLSELIDQGGAYDADQIVAEVLDQLVVLEGEGLYHNDVRCWNVLVSDAGQAQLIDYGAISTVPQDCSWLEDLLLSFLITVGEILARRIVPSMPDREPALDLFALAPRYRNAFIHVFGLDKSRWTFAELQAALLSPLDVKDSKPGWASIYQNLQTALSSHNARLSALYAQTRHDRVELEARASALERVRQTALQAEEKLEALKIHVEAADNRSSQLEESSRLLAEWAKEVEAGAIKSDADRQQLATRLSEVEGNSESLAIRIEALDMELVELRHARDRAEQVAETLVAEAGRLTGERDSLLVKVADGQTLSEQHEATIHHLRGKIAALLHRIERLERSRAHDRRRLKELQVDLSAGAQAAGSSRTRVRELEMAVEVLEGQIRNVYASRSWRLTAPVRWFGTKVLRRGAGAVPAFAASGKPRRGVGATHAGSPSPADVAVDKRLVAVDQLASRIRKSKR
jgi:O-antigen chain-terminating methyltransferase